MICGTSILRRGTSMLFLSPRNPSNHYIPKLSRLEVGKPLLMIKGLSTARSKKIGNCAKVIECARISKRCLSSRVFCFRCIISESGSQLRTDWMGPLYIFFDNFHQKKKLFIYDYPIFPQILKDRNGRELPSVPVFENLRENGKS